MLFGRRDSSDAALVWAVRQGKTGQFGALVQRYRNLVYASVLARVHDVDDADDVSQEALVAAMLADRAETLAQSVADGDITQAQADLRLAQMTASVTESTQRTEIGPRADRGNSAARGSVAQRGGFGQRVCGDDAEVARKMGGWQRGNAAADGTVVPSAMSRTW